MTTLVFFEDIKIAIDSGFVSPKMAAYLFGYYITEFDDAIVNSTVFHRDAPLWSKYRGLVEQMRSELDNNNFNNFEF